MLKHIVLGRPKEDTTAAQLEQIAEKLRGLAAIDVVQDIHCGQNLSDRGGGYSLVLIVEFASKDDLNEYLPHPRHQAVLPELDKVLEGILVADLEV